MTDQPAIDAGHAPETLLRVLNPTLRVLLKTPLGRGVGDFMVVDFSGRKSGKKYSIPVSAHQLDGDLYVVLEAQWKYNFAGGADADVYFRGRKQRMRGELLRDRAAVAAVASRLATSYGPTKAQRQMGLKFTDGHLPTVADWEQAVDAFGVAAIRLTSKP